MITPITKRDPRKLYLERLVFMAALLIPAVFRGGFRPLCSSCCIFRSEGIQLYGTGNDLCGDRCSEKDRVT